MSEMILPKIVFGTSGLGNLYNALDYSTKRAIVAKCLQQDHRPVVFDSAGKYGAGLALETLGQCLRELDVNPQDVLISNKLGWLRTELKSPEPTFEPGVWKDLKFDAVQKISYEGILECYEQGNKLLNGFDSQLISVHDPDEYLFAAENVDEMETRYQDILNAYRALHELKKQGKVKAIGIGAKNWKIIEKIEQEIELDWVMIANSMTVHSHPVDLLLFMQHLQQKNIKIINSAVFNGGFLTGGDYYNYRLVEPLIENDIALLNWRELFNNRCKQFNILPFTACVNFGLNAPGVTSIALNTTNPDRVASNIELTKTEIPISFWETLITDGLISKESWPLYLNAAC